MNKLKIGLSVLGVLAIAIVAGLSLGYFNSYQKVDQALGVVTTTDFRHQFADVIGTHVGTSTVGVAIQNVAGGVTTSVISNIGERVGTAVYTIKVVSVSSTVNNLAFSVEGTYDDFCTANSSTIQGEVRSTDINWFSAGDHLKGKVHATSFTSASSTSFITWTDMVAGVGNELILTDLNYECLRFNAAGNSSTIYVGLKTK